MSTTTAGPGSTGPSRHVQCSGADARSRRRSLLVGCCADEVPRLDALDDAGSASVVVSPSASSSATLRSSRRMILPERVFGSSSVNRIVFGFAIGPMSVGDVVAQLVDERVARLVAAAQDHERGDRLARSSRRCGRRPRPRRPRGGRRARDSTSVGRDVVAGDEHDVVDAAEQPEVAVVVALGAVAGEVPAVEARPVRVAVALAGRPRCRAASTATAGSSTR